MKFFAVILSLYFLGLNFMPCDDDAVTSGEEECVSISTVLDQEQHENDGDGADECPPFCQCHCCHVHVVNLATGSFEVFEPEILSLAPAFGENSGSEITNFHFQPPRI